MKKSAAILMLVVCCGLLTSLVSCGDEAAGDSATTPSGAQTVDMATMIENAQAMRWTPIALRWTQLTPSLSAPSPRAQADLFYDPESRGVILYGGLNGSETLNDLWLYDVAANTWTSLRPAGEVPSARFDPNLVYDPEGRRLILYGGRDDSTREALHDTWIYELATNTWNNVQASGEGPACTRGGSFVWDPDGGKVISFGGATSSGETLSEAWAYDPATTTWSKLDPTGAAPAARAYAGLAYDPTGRRVILYGGSDPSSSGTMSDTWAYDPAANTWTELPSTDLGARGFYPQLDTTPLYYDPNAGRMICFKQEQVFGYPEQLFAYDPATNAWAVLGSTNEGEGASYRTSSSFVYDPDTGQVILFGGILGSEYFNDVWTCSVALPGRPTEDDVVGPDDTSDAVGPGDTSDIPVVVDITDVCMEAEGTFDIDEDGTPDLRYRLVDGEEPYLFPLGGARLAIVGATRQSFELGTLVDLQGVSAELTTDAVSLPTADPTSVSLIAPGMDPVIALYTGSGRYAKIWVAGFAGSVTMQTVQLVYVLY
jgi:hypothetical protein